MFTLVPNNWDTTQAWHCPGLGEWLVYHGPGSDIVGKDEQQKFVKSSF